MAEYRGYTITQDTESCHVIVSKDGHMVMHIPCTERKTDEELEEMVGFYEDLMGRWRRGELQPIQSLEELSCRSGVY